jgi:hypothetical protein
MVFPQSSEKNITRTIGILCQGLCSSERNILKSNPSSLLHHLEALNQYPTGAKSEKQVGASPLFSFRSKAKKK